MVRFQDRLNARGVALVEFVLCLTLFLMVGMAILGWGLALRENQMLRECARCAARAAALAPDGTPPGTVTQRAIDTYNQFLANAGASPGGYLLRINPGFAGGAATIEVTVQRTGGTTGLIAGLFEIRGQMITALVGTNSAVAYP